MTNDAPSSAPNGGDGAPYRPVEERCNAFGACVLDKGHDGLHSTRPSPPAQPSEPNPNSEAVRVTIAYYGDEPTWLVDSEYEAAFVRRWLARYVETHPEVE